METLKTDDQKRLKIPGAQPGRLYSYLPNPDGSFVLTPVAETEAKVVNPVRGKNGRLIWPVKLDPKKVSAAIRADRDAQ